MSERSDSEQSLHMSSSDSSVSPCSHSLLSSSSERSGFNIALILFHVLVSRYALSCFHGRGSGPVVYNSSLSSSAHLVVIFFAVFGGVVQAFYVVLVLVLGLGKGLGDALGDALGEALGDALGNPLWLVVGQGQGLGLGLF